MIRLFCVELFCDGTVPAVYLRYSGGSSVDDTLEAAKRHVLTVRADVESLFGITLGEGMVSIAITDRDGGIVSAALT